MKKTILMLLVGIITLFSFTNRNTDGSIVVIDDDCIIATNSNNTITAVEFVNQSGVSVMQVQGCFQSACSFSLAGLPSEEYKVIVRTSNQSSFSKQIVIN